MLAPTGYEYLTVVIAAPSIEVAEKRALKNPEFKEMIDLGAPMFRTNITLGLSRQGYSVDVQKMESMFH